MEFFLFAGLMGLDMLLFFFLAARYTYVEADDENKKDFVVKAEASLAHSLITENPKNALGTENKGFSDDTSL